MKNKTLKLVKSHVFIKQIVSERFQTIILISVNMWSYYFELDILRMNSNALV